MDFLYLKMVLVVHGWVFAAASPVAMVQHATSSQSFVIHEPYATSGSSSNLATGPSLIGQPGGNQPKYEYKYEVSDHQTGDRKSHWETREGDRVRGGYTLYEPDGALRRVEYSADALHGFNAIVTREGQTKHHPPTPQPSFGGSSPHHDSYESSSRGYIPDRGSPVVTPGYTDRARYQGSSIDSPRAEYNVNHGVLKSNDVLPKPY